MNHQKNPHIQTSADANQNRRMSRQGVPGGGVGNADAVNRSGDTQAQGGGVPGRVTDVICAGMTIEGRYKIESLLGSGGFATVYKARHLRIDQEVALKVMDLRKGVDPGYHARFFREAQVAAKIKHNNVVKVFDYGTVEQTQQPYIAMELLDGHDLCKEVEKKGPLSPLRTFRLFRPVLDALAVGHQLGIVHKDLKPENLFLTNVGTSRECMKILDFGVARIESARTSRLTSEGQLFGTPQYLAPEYIRTQIVSPAVDVYQMALIISEVLTGIPAVSGDPFNIMMQHCEGKLCIADFLLEGEVGNVFCKALAIQPEERYADAEAFGAALDSIEAYFSSDEPVVKVAHPNDAVPQASTKITMATGNIRPIATTMSLVSTLKTEAENPQTRKDKKPHTLLWIGGMLFALMIVSVVVLSIRAIRQDAGGAGKLQDASEGQNEGMAGHDAAARAAENQEPQPFKFTVDIKEFYRQTLCDEDEICRSLMDLGKEPEIPIYVYNPTSAEVRYDLDCDGDGEYEQKGLSESTVCRYDEKYGKHQIAILGSLPGLILCGDDAYGGDFGFANNYGPVSIDAWGSMEWKTMHAFAQNCAMLELAAQDRPNLRHVMDMSSMFAHTGRFNQPVGDWDVSKVRNMNRLFEEAEIFNQPLDAWDVSSVRTMEFLFAGAVAFNQPLESWDVSGVTSMAGMFAFARAFNQPLERWDVSHVTSMDTMFTEANAFDQPLAKWDLSSVQTVDGMFRGASSFNQPIGSWNVSMVKVMDGMFNRAEKFNQPLDTWLTYRVMRSNAMFWGATSFNQNLDSWDMSSNQDMRNMFYQSGMKQMPTWYK